MKLKAQLLQENELLRQRLADAEAALDAIRTGEVDALVVSSSQGDQVFTLQGAEHPYRVMVEAMNEGAATLLRDGTILFANPRLANILDEPLESLIGSSILNFITPEDRAVFEGLVEQAFRSASKSEVRFRGSNQSTVPVLVSFSPTQVEGAQALCLVATDLTEQKRSEEIVAAERLARSILEQAADIILVCDTDGKIIRANQKALQIFHRNPIFKHFTEVLPLAYKFPEDDGHFSIAKVLSGQSFQEIEMEYSLLQGPTRFFLLSAAPLFKSPEQIIGCIITLTEMTERKRAEKALRESEKRFRSVVEANMFGVAFADTSSGQVMDANDEYLRIIGRSRTELEAGQVNWKAITPTEGLEREEQMRLTDPPGRNRPPYEKEYLRPDGTRSSVILGGAYLDDERKSMVALVLDITERKKADLLIHSYSAQLARSNQELQDFAAIASHDLQEPLRKIESFGSLIGKRSVMDVTERDYLERMQGAARRMRKMIDDLLELSRVTTRGKPYEPVDMNEVVKKVVDDLEPHIQQEQGRVVLHPLPTLDADGMQMYRLLQNLVANAVKYHQPNSAPLIAIGYRESAAGWVELYVQDNGIGFDMEYLDQIFLPFRRLHGRGEYEGSGIGLAICRKIAERHGGAITAHSVVGAGSTFLVRLPLKQLKPPS